MICLLSMKKRGGNTHLQLSNFDKGGGGWSGIYSQKQRIFVNMSPGLLLKNSNLLHFLPW